jgi:hypothetical protein
MGTRAYILIMLGGGVGLGSRGVWFVTDVV